MKKYFPVLQYVNAPNIITTFGLILGVAACFFLIQGNLRGTIICLFSSMFMDLLDGFLAEKLNQKTKFGQYMDSLVDFFICCIMPMLMAFVFVGRGSLIFAAAAFYCACGLWRLAYFNHVTAAENRPYFTGLPVPGSSLLVGISIWLVVYYSFPSWICGAAFFVAGLLKISGIKLKKYGAWQKILWTVGLAFIVLVAIG